MEEQVFIGCSGFTERTWKGFFYPEELPSKEYLSYYSNQVNSVEINSTFYRRPTLKTLEKWYSQTEENFKFFIKIPKSITHLKKLSETKEETEAFCSHISSGLQNKLAGFLFQFPPSFHYSEENLDLFLKTVSPKFLNVVEFRHTSWWNPDVFSSLNKHHIIFSGVSIPKDIPDDVIMNSSDFLYYRLHGVPVLFKSEYELSQLETLAEKIREFTGTAYIFFNNTWGKAGIKNALELKEILRKP